MSELKYKLMLNKDMSLVPCYLKSEADKYIGELKKEIAELKEGAKNLILDNYLNDKEIRRQKYKRCLAMAELCCERKENCYNIALRKYTKSEADSLAKKSEFWEEWEDTWTQLAYRFSETYNENKNQEEQTI